DSNNLDLYLTELGIDYQHRNEIISKAINAVLQYGQPYNHQRLKIRLEKVAAAGICRAGGQSPQTHAPKNSAKLALNSTLSIRTACGHWRKIASKDICHLKNI